jgi:hypothetical protein
VDLQKYIPAYLMDKKNLVQLVIFTSVFALVFINIYSPFGVGMKMNRTQLGILSYSSLTILGGILVVVISRLIMYYTYKKHNIRIWQYILWALGEVLCMALFYAAFEKIFLKDERLFEELVKTSAQQTALVLLLPYSASWLYFSWQDKKQQLASLEGLQGYQGSPRDMIAFYDDKSVLKFSVKKEYLLYIESAENYISIGYLDKGKLARYMLRDTLKNVEEMFSGTEIIRCHRSYMVNFEKVKIIRKGKDGLKLELEAPLTIDIPVSKTYVDGVMNTFARYSRAAETV